MAYPGGMVAAFLLLLVALGVDLIAVIMAFTRLKGPAIAVSVAAVVLNTAWWAAAFTALAEGAPGGGRPPTEVLVVLFGPCVLQVGVVALCVVAYGVGLMMRSMPGGVFRGDDDSP